MVRIGTLPTRLLSLASSATLVWSPEIVDKAIIGATRVVNPKTGVISFLGARDKREVFTCHPLEKDRLIFQLGSADPKLAVEAVKVVAEDVGGIGLNCGCPKPFSISGGMGAALLSKPDLLISVRSPLSRPILGGCLLKS
jgi:tRNA-dihydrouridine synthase 2